MQVMERNDWPANKARCCYGDTGCVCTDMEKSLRGWVRGDEMPAMTAEQRAACLSEIGQVEGYTRSDHENEDDATLANTTLAAWTDYCRDKGMF